jgi:hypothetical protein
MAWHRFFMHFGVIDNIAARVVPPAIPDHIRLGWLDAISCG